MQLLDCVSPCDISIARDLSIERPDCKKNVQSFSNCVFPRLKVGYLIYRSLLESHKQALIEKLKETDSPSLILHLVSLILFQSVTQNMLNASGRFVSNILNFIEKRLPADAFAILQRYHG